MIERLVRAFYRRARLDPLIGPVFEAKVQDWESYIERMCAFWSSVALMSGRYHGQPMAAHLPLPINTPHFDPPSTELTNPNFGKVTTALVGVTNGDQRQNQFMLKLAF